ncbi:hypothetical protein ACIBP6_43120 [Nonomuraea terrae]|uniref:hypothetical protein n=1 Tax=Nonomuraea terrae TaxID=2530383 RepID=UPI0037BABE38
MSDLVIPDHLLTYDPARWLPQVERVCHFPTSRAWEKFRQAQDRWATQHRLGRAEFEALVQQQTRNADARTHSPED